MQYLLAVHDDPTIPTPTPEEMQVYFAQVDTFNKKLMELGHWVFAGGLQEPSTATTVQVRDNGEVLITDGPYAETKEHLGGFWIIEAPDLDRALELAKEGSVACGRAVEVRPFQGE